MNYDAIIIGASTAGLYAAELLAEGGLEVALFEREEDIQPDRRVYIITQRLARVLGDLPDTLIRHRIEKMAVGAASAERTINLGEPDLILERRELTHHLAERARKAGAAVFTGMDFQTFRKADWRTEVLFQDREGSQRVMSSGTIIGADGVYSRTAREAGLLQPAAVPLLQAEVRLPEGWDPALAQAWFDPSATRYFFWLIPESPERGVVGLIGEPGRDLHAVLEGFLADHGLEAEGFQSGQAAVHHPSLRPWGEVHDSDVLLVGDAAGQVKVTTVGGTVTGLWGARAAAEAVLGDKAYADTVQSLARELDLHWWIRSLLERLDQEGYQNLIQRVSPGVERFLAAHDRDSMKANFWKLPFVQPLYIPQGLKLLLTSSAYPDLRPTLEG